MSVFLSIFSHKTYPNKACGRKEWDKATSPNSTTYLALYSLLRSLILARSAIPKMAD